MFRIILILTSAWFWGVEAQAVGFVGSGFNSATGGRLIPTLNLGLGTKSFEIQFSSTGVSTTAYYQSIYKFGGYWTYQAGKFIFGRVEAGFGPGLLFSVRGFADDGASEQTKTDYVIGPTFFVRWVMVGPLYISVDGLYGLIGPSSRAGDLVGLNARDNASFSIGVCW